MKDRCFVDDGDEFEYIVCDKNDKTDNDNENNTTTKENHQNTNKSKCPECGEDIIFEGGCNVCKQCGWSKCD